MLRKVEESNDPNVRYEAYTKLASARAYDSDEQKARAAKVLAEKLASGKEPDASRAVICHTLGALGRPEGREVLLRALVDPHEAVRHSACRALGRVGKTEDWTILARIMATDPDRDNQVAAIEGLAALKPADPRADEFLVDGMESGDAAIRLASYRALCAISGKDLGLDPKPWKKYAEDRTKAVAAAEAIKTQASAAQIQPKR
jgi:HEAT repeat protein